MSWAHVDLCSYICIVICMKYHQYKTSSKSSGKMEWKYYLSVIFFKFMHCASTKYLSYKRFENFFYFELETEAETGN